jgi:hypothetical protein
MNSRDIFSRLEVSQVKMRNGKRAGITTFTLILLAAGTVWIVTAIGSNHPTSANKAKVPACQASRITVTLGRNMKQSSKYPLAVQLVPVIFKNDGPTCHLRIGGPVAQAIAGSAPVRSVKSSELSFPAIMSSSFGAVELKSDRQAEALFEVWKVPASGSGNIRGCRLRTATRLSIGGYAFPIATQRVFERILPRVCFETGGATPRLNTEITWLSVS